MIQPIPPNFLRSRAEFEGLLEREDVYRRARVIRKFCPAFPLSIIYYPREQRIAIHAEAPGPWCR